MAIVKDLIVLGSTRQIGSAYAGTIYAESFVKNGSDSSHVLLGDGSHMALSSLNSSHTHYVGTTQVQNSSAAQGLTGITSIASPASTALYISPASTLYLDSAASTSILFRKGTTEMARFNTSSNLCIGTTNPNDNTTYKLDVGGKGRFSNQIVSSLASGTAPFVVASSTMVTNLNADLLDGKHSSAFALSSHDHDDQYLQLSGGIITGDLSVDGITKLNDTVVNRLDVNEDLVAYDNILLWSDTGNSPSLIFNRAGSSLTDWKMQVKSGNLYFSSATDGSSFTDRAYFKDGTKQLYADLLGNAYSATNLTSAPSLGRYDDTKITVTAGNQTSEPFVVHYAKEAAMAERSDSVSIEDNSTSGLSYNILFHYSYHSKLHSTSNIQVIPSTGEVTAKHFTVTHVAGGQNEYRLKYSTTVDMAMMIGSGNTNHGLYDIKNSKWMIVADQSGNVTVNGNATTATTATNLASNPSLQASGTTQITVTAGNKTSAAFTVPYATTAAKLGSSTVGASNKPIYLNAGTPTAVTSVGEAFLSWGGQNISSGITPIGMTLSSEHSANRTAFINGDLITMSYSGDGGATWHDYNYSATTKSTFFTKSTFIPIGRPDDTTETVANQSMTRITLTAQDGTNPANRMYTRPKKLLVNMSTSCGVSMLVEYRTGTGYNNNGEWSTFGTYPVSGQSGWNDIPLILTTLGGGSTQTENVWQLRLTFTVTRVSTSSPKNAYVIGARIFGETTWSCPSKMAETGHLYDFDMSQNMILPAALYSNATTETQNLGTSSKRWNIVYAKSLNLSDYSNISTGIGLGNYLPLSGGTMIGNITMGTRHYIYGINETYGSMLHFDGTRTVVGSVGASTTSATLIRSKTGHTEVSSRSGTTYTIWDSGNDGSGSGLDADMLDGKHATYFTPATWMNSYLKLSGGTITGNVTCTGDLTATENTVLNNLFVMGDTILGSAESNYMLINYNRIGFNNNTSIEIDNLGALWGTL